MPSTVAMLGAGNSSAENAHGSSSRRRFTTSPDSQCSISRINRFTRSNDYGCRGEFRSRFG